LLNAAFAMIALDLISRVYFASLFIVLLRYLNYSIFSRWFFIYNILFLEMILNQEIPIRRYEKMSLMDCNLYLFQNSYNVICLGITKHRYVYDMSSNEQSYFRAF
jgi:hypothetical protein